MIGRPFWQGPVFYLYESPIFLYTLYVIVIFDAMKTVSIAQETHTYCPVLGSSLHKYSRCNVTSRLRVNIQMLQ